MEEKSKIDSHIPTEQAAYRAGRGTTEHAFTYKILAEKAITSQKYELDITLTDMSKGFDTVRRSTLMTDLKSILDPAELHLVKILVEDVRLVVRIGAETSDLFTTKMGVPQGDCLSPILFTLYLAKALQPEIPRGLQYHTYNIPDLPVGKEELQDNTNSRHQDIGFLIQPKYADDIGWGAVNCKHRIQAEKEKTVAKLTERGLKINEAKIEEYQVSANGDDAWKMCKILGILLDTQEDIKRRKQLANNALRNLCNVFGDKTLDSPTKIRVFRACVESVFLYNSELWTTNKFTNNKIDSFHR